MLRRLWFFLFVLLAAVAGAVAGRVAAELRRRAEAGDDPLDLDLSAIRLRPADVVPGLVAAFRVRDAPWSWLHIPSWLAAFGVNLGVAAVGGDLTRLREMAERAAFGMAGIEFPEAPSAMFDADEDGPPPPRPATTSTSGASGASNPTAWPLPPTGEGAPPAYQPYR